MRPNGRLYQRLVVRLLSVGLLRRNYIILGVEIMIVKLLLLILALALLTLTGKAQDDYRPRQKDLSWGAKAGALRAAAWTNPATDTAFVAVRNFSSRMICYCEPPFEVLPALYARRNAVSQWQPIPLKTPPQERTVVAICNTVHVKPNEEMPNYTRRKKNTYSFSVDLREYSFPADLSGEVEVKFVLHLAYAQKAYCTPQKEVRVESKAFVIKLPFPEAAAQR
jgi:hypothetical protein